MGLTHTSPALPAPAGLGIRPWPVCPCGEWGLGAQS